MKAMEEESILCDSTYWGKLVGHVLKEEKVVLESSTVVRGLVEGAIERSDREEEADRLIMVLSDDDDTSEEE